MAAAVLLALPAAAQAPLDSTGGFWAWKPMTTIEGVEFSYLFHREASGEDAAGNGVVLRLRNANAYAVAYRFVVVFRAPDEEPVEEEVTGSLGPHEAKTGSAAGLFWIPFGERASIGEVGLRGYEVVRVREG